MTEQMGLSEESAYPNHDPSVTGGLPAIPENATRDGNVDVSSLEAGTTITVYTESLSRFTLTVLSNGQVTVKREVWIFGLSSFISSEVIRDQVVKAAEVQHHLNEQYKEEGLQIKVKITGIEFEGIGDLNDTLSLSCNPILAVFSGDLWVSAFGAGDRLTLRRRREDDSKRRSSPVLFWVIEKP